MVWCPRTTLKAYLYPASRNEQAFQMEKDISLLWVPFKYHLLVVVNNANATMRFYIAEEHDT